MIIDNKEAHYASDRLLFRSSVMILYMNDHIIRQNIVNAAKKTEIIVCSVCVS